MKIMRPVIAWLRQLGCRIITYIDDNLIMASTKEEANNLAEIAVTLLESLGFLVNPTFLGFCINSSDMTIQVPQQKLLKMQLQAKNLLGATSTTGRELARFVGTVSLMALGIPPAPLFYRALQHAKNSVIKTQNGLDTQIPIEAPLREELQWWLDQAHSWNGRSLAPPRESLWIQTDASKMG